MKVGDLVKVSNKGFTAIGYIKENGGVYYTVRYLVTLEDNGKGNHTGGLWSPRYVTLLEEVKHEKEISKA